jgi:hypothetical protein
MQQLALCRAPSFNAAPQPQISLVPGAALVMIARMALALACFLPPAYALASGEEPTGYACTFTNGITNSYEKGAYAPEKAAPLRFGISGIDLKAQTAVLETSGGKGQLRIVRAVNATHFLEVASEGYLYITTIYDKDDAKGAYPAVHSRHFGLFGQPIVTQYQGFCDAKD